MKSCRLLMVALSLGALAPGFSQADKNTVTLQLPSESPPLTEFDLDFAGGTPAQLVAAIEKAQGKPMNAVVPSEFSAQQLPALKMRGVNLKQLFRALNQASEAEKFQARQSRNGEMIVQRYGVQFGFRTLDDPVSDNSVWYFYSRGLPEPSSITQNVCRFYQLSPYLKRGLNVDDITTAIQAGWRMSGLAKPPALNFHKETSLLIAVGASDQLKMIEDVLAALEPQPAAPPKEQETPAKSGS